ncbi:MAG: enoyl-CoA hydratase/isomerase family protein [Hydrogenophilaceae bacterium]|nr:enoyl-CoA hydratase/isomerase family protein [Hydrogenophilaceae bacterium]
MSEAYETILYEVDDPVAIITLNRTARMNAWNLTMARELQDAVQRAGDDRRVVGVIITGAGRAFCSGGDMKDLTLDDLKMKPTPQTNGEAARSESGGGEAAGSLAYFMNLPKPVVAAINGPAVGMGAVLALWTDLRFMAEEAMLSMAFSQRGTVAEGGSSCLLTRLAGASVAIDLLISSRRVSAEEALRLGLVNGVAPSADLVRVARDYIGELARTCSPTSIATMKRQVYADLSDNLGASVKAARKLLAEAVEGPDIKEGWRSFLEKRPARYVRLGST